MLGCAAKLGFTKIKRELGAHIVDGQEREDVILEKRFGS